MIVYSNSCSYGIGYDHLSYSDYVADHLSAKLINEGRPGSCNRRIIRSSLRSLSQLCNDHDNILVLIGLSFIHRTEIWQPNIGAIDNDGDFHPIQLLENDLDWTQGLNTRHDNVHNYAVSEIKDYYKQWLLHYSKEAEITNLLTDIIMFSSFCKNNKIKYLIFNNAENLSTTPDVDINSPFLAPLVTNIKKDPNVIDLWNFNFCGYSINNGFRPRDEEIWGIHGHHGEEAHKEFASVLLSKL
jgi:hypothetical protein